MNPVQNQPDSKKPSNLEPMAPMWPAPPAYYPQYYDEGEEVNLLDYWRVLMKHKWQIFLVTLLCAGLAFGATRIMPKKYKAEVTIMPLSSSGSGGLSGMASQMGSVPLLGGALGDLTKLGGGKSKELVNILKSRTLTEKIVLHFDLIKVLFADQYDPKTNSYFPKFMKPVPVLEDAVRKFKSRFAVVEEDKKTGLVKISVTTKDSDLSAKIANRMVAELQNFIENNSLTLSKRNRIFLEEQLVKNRAKLLEAGKELNQFYADNKISSVVPQLDVSVGSYQTIPKAFEEFNEEYKDLDAQQKVVEEKKNESFVKRVPGQVYLQFLTLNRELLAKSYALLTQQYELAKIDEAKEDLAFQVIDKAEVTIRQSSPNLILNMAIGIFGGFFFAVFLAFFREYISKMKEKEARK